MSKSPRGWHTHLDDLQPFLAVALQCAAVPVMDSILDASRMQSARELFRAYLSDLQTAEVFVPAAPEDRPWHASVVGCCPEDRLALCLLVARFVSRMERYDLTTDVAHLTVPIGVFTKFPRVLLGQLLVRDLAQDGPAWVELLDAAETLQRLFPGGEDLVAVLDALRRTFSSGKLSSALRAELASTVTRWLSSNNELLWPLAREVQRLIGGASEPAHPIDQQAWAVTLINDVAGERLIRPGPYRDLGSMRAIRQRGLRERAQIALTATVGLAESVRHCELRSGRSHDDHLHSGYPRACLWVLRDLLTARLPLTDDELASLIALSGLPASHALHVLENDLEGLRRGLVRQIDLCARHEPLGRKTVVAANALEARLRRDQARSSTVLANRLARVTGNLMLPIVPEDPWAAAADVRVRGAGERTNDWMRLLHHCQATQASRPSRRWLEDASKWINAIGAGGFRSAIVEWFRLAKQARTDQPESEQRWTPIESNSLVLRGLAWCCALCPDDEPVRALGDLAVTAYRKVPWVGARMPKVGNACLWALQHLNSQAALRELAGLRHRLRAATPTVRARIDRALHAVAAQLGLTDAELAEAPPPTFGMKRVGAREFVFGDVEAELQPNTQGTVGVVWRSKSKVHRSMPPRVRKDHAEALAELRGCKRDMQHAVLAERARLDSLFLEHRQWSFDAWRQRYLDHPLVGVLARRLIWRFSHGGMVASAIFDADQLVDSRGAALNWLNDHATVELWHPVTASISEVLAWRDWLERHEVRQPFKQAHREVYLLTDAERQTAVYSNRFAGHILRQHQFHGLCAARGWQNHLLLLGVDSGPTPPTRRIPAYVLRAEFWVAGVGEDFETDATGTGVFRHISTDQVRFYALGDQAPTELATVHPIVFSEIMRDLDLFVGVASVGNDPTWFDGGPGGRFREYWSTYAFGELRESGHSRAELLERLLPRLPIGERCSVDGRFLVVRGDLGEYRIHLNSAGVLMQPGDRYLCIVPDRSSMGTLPRRVYLPFEGDEGLSIILSKAFLLAADSKITDPTIVRQIRAYG